MCIDHVLIPLRSQVAFQHTGYSRGNQIVHALCAAFRMIWTSWRMEEGAWKETEEIYLRVQAEGPQGILRTYFQIVILLPSYVSTSNSAKHLLAGVSDLAYRKCSKWLIRWIPYLPHAQLPNCCKFDTLLMICEINGDRDHRSYGTMQVWISLCKHKKKF